MPDEGIVENGFSGKMIITDLGGSFLNGYRLSRDTLVSQFIAKAEKGNDNQKLKNGTDCDENYNPGSTFCEEELEEVVITGESHPVDDVPIELLFLSDGTPYHYDPYGNIVYGGGNGDNGDNGGSSSSSDPSWEYHSGLTDNQPPDCKSFNYKVTVNNVWQEAAVRDIYFHIWIVADDIDGTRYKYTVRLSGTTLFGAPKNFTYGGEVGTGIRSEISARALDEAMRETAHRYAGTYVNPSVVESYFKERLKYNFPLFIPGGRVNFNIQNSNVTPSNYVASWRGYGNCN